MIDDEEPDDEGDIEVSSFDAMVRLSRDLLKASLTLSEREARFLVDAYYNMQKHRVRAASQVRALNENEEPHMLITWLNEQSGTLEGQIKNALNRFSLHHPDGAWLHSIVGIGPVLASGMIAHIDVKKAPTVGHIWRFAGLDPTLEWKKSEKRPWNAGLKVVCWKAGESFVKNCNREGCYYGQIYTQRKEYEHGRNIRGELANQAADILKKKNYKHDTEAYKAYIRGLLPPAHIHARARRYAVKLFLAHYHYKAHVRVFGVPPPYPYPIAHMGHVDFLPPPD